MASEPEALAEYLQGLSGTVVAVGLEAGPLSQWLHKHLTEAGFEIVLMETRQVKGALKAMPIKTKYATPREGGKPARVAIVTLKPPTRSSKQTEPGPRNQL